MSGEPAPVTQPRPRVTVILLTYNHEAFVEQAMRSVLMQQAEFAYELVVLEDCSTDGTAAIVRGCAALAPDRVDVREEPRNRNDNAALRHAVLSAAGEYVALLDGDDYWTDPDKLRKQVAFLDSHPECSICFHNVLVDQGEATPFRTACEPNQKAFSTLDDLWSGNFIATVSVMYRRAALTDIPDWFVAMRFADWPLHLLFARHGRIGYLPDVMAVYRRHRGGLYSGLPRAEQLTAVLAFYDELEPHMPDHRAEIAAARTGLTCELARAYAEAGQGGSAARTLAAALLASPSLASLRRCRHAVRQTLRGIVGAWLGMSHPRRGPGGA